VLLFFSTFTSASSIGKSSNTSRFIFNHISFSIAIIFLPAFHMIAHFSDFGTNKWIVSHLSLEINPHDNIDSSWWSTAILA
jgi:hypothetical protein